MNELKYVGFGDIQLLVERACELQNKKIPVARTLRHWLDNDMSTQVVHVRKYKTKYNMQDAIQMLYTDHHIVISSDTQNADIKNNESKLMTKYHNDSAFKSQIDQKIRDLKLDLILNIIVKRNGYSKFDESMMLNDLLLMHNESDTIEKGNVVANIKNANTRRYLIKKRGNK